MAVAVGTSGVRARRSSALVPLSEHLTQLYDSLPRYELASQLVLLYQEMTQHQCCIPNTCPDLIFKCMLLSYAQCDVGVDLNRPDTRDIVRVLADCCRFTAAHNKFCTAVGGRAIGDVSRRPVAGLNIKHLL